jgi:hypothetical protein
MWGAATADPVSVWGDSVNGRWKSCKDPVSSAAGSPDGPGSGSRAGFSGEARRRAAFGEAAGRAHSEADPSSKMNGIAIEGTNFRMASAQRRPMRLAQRGSARWWNRAWMSGAGREGEECAGDRVAGNCVAGWGRRGRGMRIGGWRKKEGPGGAGPGVKPRESATYRLMSESWRKLVHSSHQAFSPAPPT